MTNTMTHVEELRKVASLDQCAWDYAQKLMRSSAEEIERLDADAAGVQAELESVKLERHQLRNELTAARLENQQRRALLVEVYNHGENSELHGRIGAALGAAPGEDASPSEPSEGPASLVGALQDVVHTDTGPVRAGHSVKSEAPLGSREREAYEAELKRLRDSLAQRT